MRIWRVSFTDCLLRPEVAAKIAVEMRTANGAARIVDEGSVFPNGRRPLSKASVGKSADAARRSACATMISAAYGSSPKTM
jgi:hypothetical protein